MNAKQREAKKIINDGHNLILIGQGGTGKTYTIKNCVDSLRSAGKHVSLTCYTGIACLQYRSMNAMTLHRFAGLEDGRHNNHELLNLILHDERFEETKRRIRETNVLIIDEVSMASQRTFNQVEFLCRNVRTNSHAYFGGMQIILCGDFYQLPPIKDEMYGDYGHFCFESEIFSSVFPHVLKLTEVYRQKEESLTKAVNELERGELSAETIALVNSLSRPFPVASTETVKLFCRNLDVDIYNFGKLGELQDQLHAFTSEDEGDIHYLNKLLAQKHLGVKLMAPVMLLKNLTDKLVNGLIGNIVKISEDTIDVEFICNGVSTQVPVRRCNFTKHDPVNNVCVAKRYQFPLKLAYSLTIHKSQGMTLPYVDVDCKNASQAGQIGVAVGRAQSIDGLRVVNFKPSLCKKHPPQVYKFCETSSLRDITENLQCCVRSNMPSQQSETKEDIACYFQSDSDFDDELDFSERCMKVIDNLEEHNYTKQVSDETETKTHQYMERALEDFINTSHEDKARAARNKIKQNKHSLHEWISNQYEIIKKMMDVSLQEIESIKQKNLSDFYRHFNSHLQSGDYVRSVKQISTDPMGTQILTSVMFLIQQDLLKEKAQEQELGTDVYKIKDIMPSTESHIGASGKGKN